MELNLDAIRKRAEAVANNRSLSRYEGEPVHWTDDVLALLDALDRANTYWDHETKRACNIGIGKHADAVPCISSHLRRLQPLLEEICKAALERLAEVEAENAALKAELHHLKVDDGRHLAELQAVAEAAASVASEDGIRNELLAYNMGLELIQRLAALDAKGE